MKVYMANYKHMKESFENNNIKRSSEDVKFFNEIVKDYEKKEATVEQEEEYLIISIPGLETKTYIHKWRKIPKGDAGGNITGSTDIETVIGEAIEELEAKRDGIDTSQA